MSRRLRFPQFTFRAKQLASHVGLVAAVVFIVLFQLSRSLGADLERQLDQRLEEQALGAAQWGVGEGRRHPEKVAARLSSVLDADVTIFDQHGNAIGDSLDRPELEARGAPEVLTALRGNVGRASRRRTTGEEMHYVAVPAVDGWVIRFGVPLSDINATLRAMRGRILFASGLAIILALALGLLAARVAARPLRAMTNTATRIAGGDFDVDVPSSSPDEFGVLAHALASLAAQLKSQIGELTAERDRLSAILEGMVEGVLVLDASGAVVLANPAATTVLESAPPLVGKALASAVSDATLRDYLAAARESGARREGEVVTGKGRSIAIYAQPLETRAGGGVVVVLRDMTTIRRVLTMRRDFMANASHELRTPVTAIQGYAETLLRGSADAATTKQFLEIIHRHARRLGGLVDDVLKLSSIEGRPREERVRERVDVSGVASQVVETLRARAEARKVALALDLEPGLEITGDPLALEQVLENLADNAVKYGRDAGGTVRIRARKGDGDVCLEVADDGPGIAAQHLPRLFERFYRVDPSRSRERGGTGLGLAIVKELVEHMDGEVIVRSEVGQGTTFAITFPA